MPHGIPSHDTLSRLFARLDPQQFERCLSGWMTHLDGLAESDLIAIDGKAALHMVSA